MTKTWLRRHSARLWDRLEALMVHLEKVFTEPDEGIWEIRGPRRHFTHRKLMAWLAFDPAAKAVEDAFSPWASRALAHYARPNSPRNL
jgi:GH15 family glucan-1,4-alpha-glucosidase